MTTINATREEILEVYSENLRQKIASMSDDEVQASLEAFEDAEAGQKLANDLEAMGRIQYEGMVGGLRDFDELLKQANGNFEDACALYEEDLAKLADEIAETEAKAEELAESEDGEGEEESDEEFAVRTALEKDPSAFAKMASEFLAKRGVKLVREGEGGEQVEIKFGS